MVSNFDNLQGWLGPDMEKESFQIGFKEGYCDFLSSVSVSNNLAITGLYTWDIEKNLHKVAPNKMEWESVPRFTQDTGNCVAESGAHMGQIRQVVECFEGKQEEKVRRWYTPWMYAVSRNQILGGLTGPGSTGAALAGALQRYGVLFTDDVHPDTGETVPPYKGYSDLWGHRRYAGKIENAIYGKWAEVASDNLIIALKITTIEQLVEAVQNRMMVTIASYRGFSERAKDYKGFDVYVPSGRWAHQMYFTDYNEEIGALWRGNQWGDNLSLFPTGRPRCGRPNGAWNLISDIKNEMRSNAAEIYAYHNFSGEPTGPDYGGL